MAIVDCGWTVSEGLWILQLSGIYFARDGTRVAFAPLRNAGFFTALRMTSESKEQLQSKSNCKNNDKYRDSSLRSE